MCSMCSPGLWGKITPVKNSVRKRKLRCKGWRANIYRSSAENNFLILIFPNRKTK